MKNKIIWVTGASTGIGKAIAEKFSSKGCTVVITARSKSRLDDIVKEIRLTGREAMAYVCDVSSERSVIHTAKKIQEKYGTIDVLINNAGATVFKSFLDTETKDYDNVIDTNLKGPFLCMKAVLPQMIRKKTGSIINILSVAANTTFENSSVYSASKAGMQAMASCIRKEVRKHNIKICNIYPGAVETDMWDIKARQQFRNRMMTPADIGDIAFDVYNKPERLMVEDLVVRPVKGDL
ncbi:MAG: SDR family oxidoreductase [Ignavibacteria bacterium]|jgi:NADP-dependent 3-hydroxy acid dehydrogenase YdfG|nr:SDR family oxidoreductase [Ignavibacteria bacterium]